MICDCCGNPDAKEEVASRSYGANEDLLILDHFPVINCPHCGATCLAAKNIHSLDQVRELWARFVPLRYKLIDEIRRAFADVRREEGVSLHEADVIDLYGSDSERAAARAIDFDQYWWEVPGESLDTYPAFSFYDAKGLRYYLPAYMTYLLKSPRLRNNYNLTLAFEMLRHFDKAGLNPALLNEAQNRAICRFLWLSAELWMDDEALDLLAEYWGQFCESCGD